MTSLNHNYLLKTLHSNIVTLGIKVSTYEISGVYNSVHRTSYLVSSSKISSKGKRANVLTNVYESSLQIIKSHANG